MKNLFIFSISVILVNFAAACNRSSETNTNPSANRSSANHEQMNRSEMNHGAMNMNSANANQMPANNPEMSRSEMNHAEMQSAPDAKNAPYDLQFIDTMIAHHQGAVVMSKPAIEKAQHSELKNMAQNIVASQEKEIAQLREWREKWYGGKAPAMNMEMPGMSDSMRDMDTNQLVSANGADFDMAFINMMIPHHQGAVLMAKDALEKAEHPEIKTLAQNVIMAQEAEINDMNTWKQNWSK